MTRNEEDIARLADERRAAISRGIGFRPPFANVALRDASVLVPRCKTGSGLAHLHHLDVHIIGRAYGRDKLFLHAGGRTRPVHTTPGAVTVVPLGLDVTWDIPVANDFSMVMLPDDRLQACGEDLGHGRRIELAECIAVADPTTSRILELLEHEATQSDRSPSLFVERAVDLLCLQLVRAHASSHTRLDVRLRRRGLATWQVNRVTSYMRDRLDQDISLGELAVLVGLSRFHFCTAFRLATGRTPYQWLTAQRMDRARQLLADPALRITDIALAVGYSTPSAFSATFRKVAGATPSEYRRRHACTPHALET